MLSILSALLFILRIVSAHTWIEQLSLVDDNENFVGDPGFIRGFGKSMKLLLLLESNGGLKIQYREQLQALPMLTTRTSFHKLLPWIFRTQT